MNKMLSTFDGWITGLRREQTKIREDVTMFQLDHGHGGILKINPIIDWTWDQDSRTYQKNMTYHTTAFLTKVIQALDVNLVPDQ